MQLTHAARIDNIPFKMPTHVDWGPKQPDKTTVEDQKCLDWICNKEQHCSLFLFTLSTGSFIQALLANTPWLLLAWLASYPFLFCFSRRVDQPVLSYKREIKQTEISMMERTLHPVDLMASLSKSPL